METILSLLTAENLERLGAACWIISQVVATVGTPAWFPSWLKGLIDIAAANYGKAKNAK